MNQDKRKKLEELSDRLLDPGTPLERDVLIPLLLQLQEIFAGVTGVRGAFRDGAAARQYLPTGLALPFQNAADCIMDPLRTTKYLRALDRAIRSARERFPDQTIHVLYAGTGPYAPFAFPLFTRYDAREVRYTLLEIFPECIQSVVGLAREFGMEDHIAEIVQTDAAAYGHEGDPLHVVVTECMQRALTHECQVAMTLNLGRQLHPQGFFVPERITIHACLSVMDREFKAPLAPETMAQRIPLGEVFDLGPELYRDWPADRPLAGAVLPCSTIQLPEAFPTGRDMMLRTTIHLSEEIVLNDFESGLTQPYPLLQLDELQRLAAVRCEYRISQEPGFFLEKVYKSGASAFSVIVPATGRTG